MSGDTTLAFVHILLGVIFTKLTEWAVKEKTGWEKEAEEHGMTADEYLKLLKLEKENAELRVRCLEREIEKLKKEREEK